MPASGRTSPTKSAVLAPKSSAELVMLPSQKNNPGSTPQVNMAPLATLSLQSQSYIPSDTVTKSTPISSLNSIQGKHTPKTVISEWDDKKRAKRAANRLSAHLSRKRKKMFIEDLKDENSELRRKEQILSSIPDLIVVFDSSGCMSFVSPSVTRFLNYTSEELENTSFWDRLSEDSVRLIKSAFMDALAVKRNDNEDSTPLSNGESISVTLVDKKQDCWRLVSLKGVVHFAGDSPECVCSIRPVDSCRRTYDYNINKKPKKASFACEQSSGPRLAERVRAAAGAPFHQISDVESEKSNW